MTLRRSWLRGVVGLGIALLVVGQSACRVGPELTGAAGATDRVLRRSNSRFSEETSERTYVYEVQPVEGTLELCIRILLQVGIQDWRLTSPTPRPMRWEADAANGQPYRASHCFEAEAGLWELRVDMAGATGEYEIAWYHRLGVVE